MRHLTRSVVALVALAPFAAAAPAQAATPDGAKCGASKYSFLFWPKGHSARPGAGFPKFKTPHVEVYAGALSTKFPDNAIRAYFDTKPTTAWAKKCTTSKSGGFLGTVIGKKRTAAGNIQCDFGEVPYFTMRKFTGGVHFQATLANASVGIDIIIQKSGESTAIYSDKCKAKAPPS